MGKYASRNGVQMAPAWALEAKNAVTKFVTVLIFAVFCTWHINRPPIKQATTIKAPINIRFTMERKDEVF